MREHLVELFQVLVEAGRTRQQSAAGLEQISEVHGAHLALVPLGQQDRVHRTTENAGLDERAGVQPDDHRAVKQRVEVVVARVGADRIAAPHDNVAKRCQIDALPLGTPGWMRPDEDRRVAKSGRAARPDAPNPVDHEGGLGRAADKGGRADIEQDRPVRRQADLTAEASHDRATVRGRTTCRSTAPRSRRSARRARGGGASPPASACRSRRTRDRAAHESAPCWTDDPSSRRRAPWECRAIAPRADSRSATIRAR